MRPFQTLFPCFVVSLLALAPPVFANNSTAALSAGGLELIRNDKIEVLSEDLYVSAKEVRVTYRFRNKTDAPATYVVAFPLPAIDATVPEALNVMIPDAHQGQFRRLHRHRRRRAGHAVAVGACLCAGRRPDRRDHRRRPAPQSADRRALPAA